MNLQEKQLRSEFEDFSANSGVAPPSGVSARVKLKIDADLNPDLKRVLLESLGLQAVSGAVTLLFCPQFGIGPLGGGRGLMGFVESYGHAVCGLFCGAFFMSLTVILAPFWLGSPVRRVLSRNALAMAGLLVLSSLFALLLLTLMVRGEIPHLHPEFLLAWVGAALLSAYVGMIRPRFQ